MPQKTLEGSDADEELMRYIRIDGILKDWNNNNEDQISRDKDIYTAEFDDRTIKMGFNPEHVIDFINHQGKDPVELFEGDLIECENWDCGLHFEEDDGLSTTTYDTPWNDDDDYEIRQYCSDECEEGDLHSGDFNYFWCPECERQICEQNPSNGWHIQYRWIGDCEQICLRCYEEEILENGQPEEDFEGDGIKGGMFFDSGNQEPIDAGFYELKQMFIRGLADVKEYNLLALVYIENGFKVITCYESLSIGGLEGTVTMMGRKED